MKRIILKAHEDRRILSGHPWVYDNEIARVVDTQAKPAVLEPGELAEVESARKEYLGRAFVNPNSKITARIYSPSKEGVDKGFFKSRIRKAILARSDYDLHRESARLVFAEADFLPGLIIDRFVGWPLETIEASVKERPITFQNAAVLGPPGSWLSVQFLAYGMDARRELILDALEEVLAAPLLPGMEALGAPTGIIEKSGAKVRELEGLPLREGLVRGNFPPSGIVIFENDLPFAVHLEEGQKTGHFLDQRDNRRLAAACLSGLSLEGEKAPRVLDAFSYTGCFGIHAARAGAGSVDCVDVSTAALETIRINAALNGVSDKINTVEANVFDFLRAAERRKERFDLVILDPPAFAKTRPSLEDAIRGYKEINLRAITLLSKKGGVLVTSSCSQAMDEANFRRMITEAAADAGRRLVETDFRRQSADHPILVGYDESFYLKCGFYRAVD